MPGPSTWRTPRSALVLVLAVLLAVGAWQAYARLSGNDGPQEWRRGPYGNPPAALGDSAPVRPDQVVQRLPGRPEAFTHGLALYQEHEGTEERLTARALRTGRTYWTYGLRGMNLYGAQISAQLAITWWYDHWLDPTGLAVAVDPATGEARWRAEVPSPSRGMSTDMYATGSTVYFQTDAELLAMSASDGRRLWHAAPPKDCERWTPAAEVLPLGGGITALADDCQDQERDFVEYTRVILDPETGTERRRIPYPGDTARRHLRIDDSTLALLPDRDDPLLVIDASGSQPATRRLSFPQGHTVEGATDGLLIAGAGDSGTLRGVSAVDGRERWAHPPARGTRLGRAAVADGRVYVVQQPRQEAGTTLVQGSARLLVLDAHSGAVLHSTRLPRLRSGTDSVGVDNHPQLLAQHPADGTVTVTWSGNGTTAWGLSGPELLVLAESKP
ncbi:outer membrane protein assembly factor BamB family protein [Streptomyces sp. enrichment culture]|uniref:outer membrane protein assembly factor BamB family protein n=1 Tax=Streptomyces sp. enrichment culture TaxID=1795815 RepID=UPI003F545904